MIYNEAASIPKQYKSSTLLLITVVTGFIVGRSIQVHHEWNVNGHHAKLIDESVFTERSY